MRKQSESSFQASKQKQQSTELDRSDSKSVDTDNEDLEIESLDEALGHWTSQLPPFIDYAIPTSMKQGENMEVWKASENAAPVKKNSPKTHVTCRIWRDSGHKYWTCDFHGWRHIVGGIGVPNSRGFYAWFIWHGLEHNGFTKKRVLWTTSEKGYTTTFTPKVSPLQDGTFLGQTDSNQYMREQDKVLQNLKKGTSYAQSNDSPASTSSRAQRQSTRKRQRDTSPSSQLQSTPGPSDDVESNVPECPLSEEDQLKREIYDLKQAQIRLKLEQTELALEQKLERLAKTQREKSK